MNVQRQTDAAEAAHDAGRRSPLPGLGWRWMLVGACVLLAGCSSAQKDRTPDGRVIVDYWEKWTGFEGEAMQAVVDDFNASQDRILVRKLTTSQIEQKLLLATAGGNPPDVAGIWTHSLPVYAEKGALTPLNRRLRKAGIARSQYIPAIWDLCEYRDFMWGLPSTPASLALHWNRDRFREAGLDPSRPPQSLSELDAMAEKLTLVTVTRNGAAVDVRFPELTDAEKEAKEFSIVQMGYTPTWPGWWTAMWGYWFEGELWDDERTLTANSPEYIAAFTWYRSYSEKYGVKNLRRFSSSFGNFASPQSPFLAGQVAMVLQGVWLYNFIDKYAPQLDWGAAPFPTMDPAAQPLVTIVEADILAIPRGARHPDEAFEFIRYVNSQPAMEKLCLGQRKFSPLTDVSEDFLSDHPNPYLPVFIELANSPDAMTVPKIPVWSEYSQELIVAAERLFSGQVSPVDALDQAVTRSQWRFDRSLRRWERVRDTRIKQWKVSDDAK